jgi:hypothetical protein
VGTQRNPGDSSEKTVPVPEKDEAREEVGSFGD